MCCAAHFNFRNMKNDNFLFLFVFCSCIIWLPVLILILTRVCVLPHQGITSSIILCTQLLRLRNVSCGTSCQVVLHLLLHCYNSCARCPSHDIHDIHNIYLNHSPTLPLLGTGGGLDKCNILVGDTIALRGGVALLLGMLTLLNDEDTESIDVFPDRFR